VGTYDVSLTATNAYGSDDTTKIDYINVVLDYCDAGSSDGTVGYINQVDIGSISNSTGEGTYNDYTDLFTDVLPGNAQSFSVSCGNTSNMAHVLIWADWNRDGDFYDAAEALFTSAQGGGPFSGNFNVPAGVTPGNVRLRIRSEIVGYGDINDPCGYSDYGEVEDYSLNVLSPDQPPVAVFSASPTTSCDGVVQFTNESSYPESWSWDFGDGNTSILQHPLHTYDSDGTYTVSLSVSNAHGSDDTTMTDYITVDMPDAPVIADEENCGAGTVILSATASGEVNWYDTETGGNLLSTGADYTDNYTSTTTVYADNTVINPLYYVSGKPDNTGDGGYFTNTTQHGLIFDAYTEFVLESVTVYADGTGERTISLLDDTDTEIASTTLNIPDGESVVDLNFTVPSGTNYTLMGPASPNLYRNGGGTTGVLPYPFETSGVLSIHDNTAGNLEYYYYFYNWEFRVDETCVSSRTVATVTIHDLPVVDLGPDLEICEGDTYTFDAGSGFASYLWNTGETTHSIVVDTAGNFSVTVTDTNGCTATDAVNLTLNPVPVLSFSTVPENGTTCDGSVTVTVTDGDYPPLNYFWDYGQITATATGLCAGTYCVTVMNGHGCTAIGCKTVTSTTPSPVADFEADTTEGCGSLTVQFTDLSSNDPTSWSWDFGDGNTSNVENPQHNYTSMGTYTVILTATNAYGDDVEQKFGYITVYPALEVSDGSSSVACYGDAGSLTANVTGGEGTYSYHWEDNGGSVIGNTEMVGNLTAGTYYLTVSDAVGCTDNGIYTITQPDELQVIITTTDETVYGVCDGTATANVTGGIEPYDYMWDNGIGSAGATVEDLCAGTYHVTVTDANGCAGIGSGEVLSAPQPPIADFEADVTEGCGSLSVQFSDLSAHDPTSWSWDFGDGNTSTDQHPLHTYSSTGTYPVELTAANSYGSDTHTMADYITVLERPELNIDVTHESSPGSCDGELTVIINGTDNPYSVLWSNGDTSETTDSLCGGLYSVVISGNNGCSNISNGLVQTLTVLENQSSRGITLYPNPVDYMVYIESEKPMLKIDMYAVDGRLVDSWYPESTRFEISAEALNGLYMIRIADNTGTITNHQIVVK
jgi:PKD repeat protein